MDKPTSGNRTLRHATRAGKPSLDCEKTSSTASPLTSGRLTPKVEILFIIMCKAKKIPRSTKKELKAKITAAFTNLEKETVGKSCRRF